MAWKISLVGTLALFISGYACFFLSELPTISSLFRILLLLCWCGLYFTGTLAMMITIKEWSDEKNLNEGV